MYSSSTNKPPERLRKKTMIQLDNKFSALQANNNRVQDATSIGTTSQYKSGGTATTNGHPSQTNLRLDKSINHSYKQQFGSITGPDTADCSKCERRNSKVTQQVREEAALRGKTQSQTVNEIHEILEVMRGVQPQASFNSVNHQQGQVGMRIS
eukprot:10294198-Ditylum_brightwellii.AAC.1